MTFEAEILTRTGTLYRCRRAQLMDALGKVDQVRGELAGLMPHARLRLRVVYPNGTTMGRAELVAAVRAVRVLSGVIPRRTATGGAERPEEPGGGGFTCLVTRKVSLNLDKNEPTETV